jgi:hypothetical protein
MALAIRQTGRAFSVGPCHKDQDCAQGIQCVVSKDQLRVCKQTTNSKLRRSISPIRPDGGNSARRQYGIEMVSSFINSDLMQSSLLGEDSRTWGAVHGPRVDDAELAPLRVRPKEARFSHWFISFLLNHLRPQRLRARQHVLIGLPH